MSNNNQEIQLKNEFPVKFIFALETGSYYQNKIRFISKTMVFVLPKIY